MIAKVLVTVSVLAFAALVPALEVNSTHVFNPAWVPHARLHEVWQLATNTALGIVCLWLLWARNELRLPSLLTLLVTGGFLFAYVIRAPYGGSMVHPDGSEKLLLGVNAGVVVFGLAAGFCLLALVLEHRSRR